MGNINNKNQKNFFVFTIKINYFSNVKKFLDEVSLHDYGSREHKHKSIDEQVTMLLAVYFAPSNNAEDVFLKDEKDESVFFQSTLFLHLYFQKSNFKFSLTFAKNTSEKKLKNNFTRKKTTRDLFYKKMWHGTYGDFGKFQSFFPRRAHLFFQDKPDFRMC